MLPYTSAFTYISIFQGTAIRWKVCLKNDFITFVIILFIATQPSRNFADKLPGGQIDFSKAVFDPKTGMKCVIEESTVSDVEREKILECVHKKINTCHYGYVTKFKSHRVEVSIYVYYGPLSQKSTPFYKYNQSIIVVKMVQLFGAVSVTNAMGNRSATTTTRKSVP